MRKMSETGSRCTARQGRAPQGRRERARLTTGFTLLELLVVLAIMLLMAATFPLVLDRVLPGRRVTMATEHLAVAIRDAQARSIAQGKAVSVQLAILTHSFSATTHATFTDWNGRPLSTLVLYPDGSATGGQLRVVDGAHRSTLVLSAITGGTQVDEH